MVRVGPNHKNGTEMVISWGPDNPREFKKTTFKGTHVLFYKERVGGLKGGRYVRSGNGILKEVL